MANYKMLTGPFEGEVVEEGYRFLDVAFADLDDDMQNRVRNWAEDHGITDLEDAKERYENSWESVETDEPVGDNWLAQGFNAGF